MAARAEEGLLKRREGEKAGLCVTTSGLGMIEMGLPVDLG